MPEGTEGVAEVLVRFGKGGAFPHILKTGGKKYQIKKVNLIHTVSDGAVRIYFFSVSDDVNFWKLGFNTYTLSWWIEDSYSNNEGI
ncbi:MAG: hypothetical protein COT91_04245 [Candidatus Doudnabacteria bacterium CG10_big_fil_rev_8_21_14_0_10_41_10]|uniref:Uncharacterized protein n=1 Tax=Candidatus Doudnabacteria bacterium CG10_big_fil_rev_8_21_14_0_10_41_10 TaxID=1974551 RepID=A0A2H0VEW9_9BACT|nr:MAG: hypothetical protein COT91_04245 [Candidatus Doudnabacteria bacterium CG10_big_fil_rev_8_21_14_0_10_41_10]